METYLGRMYHYFWTTRNDGQYPNFFCHHGLSFYGPLFVFGCHSFLSIRESRSWLFTIRCPFTMVLIVCCSTICYLYLGTTNPMDPSGINDPNHIIGPDHRSSCGLGGVTIGWMAGIIKFVGMLESFDFAWWFSFYQTLVVLDRNTTFFYWT